MERSRLLQCLSADYMRLREVAGAGLTAKVPTCLPWTVGDLVRHVGQVYLHKAELMRTGDWPTPWPPEDILSEPPIALLDRAYGALTHEFSRRHDADATPTFYTPDQTVKFWIRRMALETVIHRLDAEFAHKVIDPAPVADDLAADGVAEVLEIFVGYASDAWPEEFEKVIEQAKGHAVEVRMLASPPATSGDPASPATPAAATGPAPAPARSWLVRVTDGRASVTPLEGSPLDPPPAATVTASPVPLLRWLWARESTPTTDAHSPIEVKGDEEAIAELRSLLRAGTQ
ncbi:maleylpyruvate isomerase N-terminal domain-containing protein [Dactylosporangium sp. CA-052675]|uniref:maleylpyruvate isomerase N-terminal domain-containing protein n=1 Tax=Dactylosporangium sp. CA-052675 TaxID=3239927 RepID=UPI003D8E4189